MNQRLKPLMTICKTKQVTLKNEDNSEFESTEIVHIGTKDDCSILIKIGKEITNLFGIQVLGNV